METKKTACFFSKNVFFLNFTFAKYRYLSRTEEGLFSYLYLTHQVNINDRTS